MLDIDIECRKGVFFVRLNGILNNETVYKIKEEILDIIMFNGIKFMVFNFENLCYIDMAGIKTLKKVQRSIKNNYGNTYICGIKSNIVRSKILNSDLLDYFKEVNSELNILKQIQL